MEHCNVNQSGLTKYQEENQALGDFILNEYYFKYFHKSVSSEDKYGRNVELIISPKCNLGCKYCYLHRHRKDIFNDSCWDEEQTIVNLKLILQWLAKHDYNPNLEIFSGELLAQEVGYRVLETIYEHFAQEQYADLRPRTLTIPTNFTFICSDEATARVEEIREKLNSIGITLCLSASFDGKYMEENRPYLHDLDIPLGGTRDDEYYDKVFQYVNKTGSGLHPMIYSKNIEKWKDNFLWFQEMMEKHNIYWEHLYLLHVRNEEWNTEQIQELCKFIEFVYEWAWEKLEHNPVYLANWIMHGNGFNLLSQPYHTCGRGLTCGIQSQFTIRVSDLMMYPCHRLGYKDLYIGQMVEDEEEVLKFKCKNPELLASILAVEKNSAPYCAQCPINRLCGGTCLGAQYESNRNIFVPIPSVCVVHYAMIVTGMKCLRKYGAWGIVFDMLDEDKKIQYMYLEEEMENV